MSPAGPTRRAVFRWAKGDFDGMVRVEYRSHTGGWRVRPEGWDRSISIASEELVGEGTEAGAESCPSSHEATGPVS